MGKKDPWERAGLGIDQNWRDLGGAQRRLAGGFRRESDAYDEYRSFDPAEAYKEYAGGAFNTAKSFLGDELERLGGTAAAAGRLNTGFYDRDQGEVIRKVLGDYSNTIAGGALQAAGMQQNRDRDLLNYGVDARNTYLELLNSNADRAQAGKNAKGSFWKTLGSIGKGAAQIGASLL